MGLYVAVSSRLRDFGERLSAERGEGVISAAIAVLVIAFLGVAMWLAFDLLMSEATDTVSDQVRDIGG